VSVDLAFPGWLTPAQRDTLVSLAERNDMVEGWGEELRLFEVRGG
jgi:hypothetical protein